MKFMIIVKISLDICRGRAIDYTTKKFPNYF